MSIIERSMNLDAMTKEIRVGLVPPYGGGLIRGRRALSHGLREMQVFDPRSGEQSSTFSFKCRCHAIATPLALRLWRSGRYPLAAATRFRIPLLAVVRSGPSCHRGRAAGFSCPSEAVLKPSLLCCGIRQMLRTRSSFFPFSENRGLPSFEARLFSCFGRKKPPSLMVAPGFGRVTRTIIVSNANDSPTKVSS